MHHATSWARLTAGRVIVYQNRSGWDRVADSRDDKSTLDAISREEEVSSRLAVGRVISPVQ